MSWSNQQVQDYYARQFADQRKGAFATGTPVEDESLLHNQIICECKRRGWIAFHSRMDKPSTVQIGSPDFVIMADCGRVFFIECKTGKGKLSTEQAALAAWANKLGHRIIVLRSIEEFYEIIKPETK